MSKNLLNRLWVAPDSDKELKPTQKLIARSYNMLVSRSQVISPMYANLLGVPASGHGRESVAQHGMINAPLSAPVLAEVFAIGGRPMFKDVKDSVRMYKDICEYLLAFKQAYENDVIRLDSNPNMMNNVLKLENLAEWVFTIAQPYIPPSDLVHKDSLAGRIGRGRFTRSTFAKKQQVQEDQDAGILVVTVGSDENGPMHGRITDGVMEQHFISQQKQPMRRDGWS